MDVLEVLLACQTRFARRHAAAVAEGGGYCPTVALSKDVAPLLPLHMACHLPAVIAQGGSWIGNPYLLVSHSIFHINATKSDWP